MNRGRASRRAERLATSASFAVVVATLALVPVTAFQGMANPGPVATAVYPGLARMSASSPGWENGVISLQFPGSSPNFTVTSLSDARVTSSNLLTAIAEVGPTGNVTASAPLNAPGTIWNFSASSIPSGTAIALTSTVGVSPSGGHWESGDEIASLSPSYMGSANVSIVFYLNASSAPAPATVRFTVSVSDWPWLRSNDTLGLELGMVAAPSTQIARGAALYNLMAVTTNGGATVASLTWGSQAAVDYGNGATGVSTVGSYRNISPAQTSSTVRIQFIGVTGGYKRVSYDPWIQLNPGAFAGLKVPAWVLTPASLTIIGVGVVATALLAVAAGRLRARPPPEEP